MEIEMKQESKLIKKINQIASSEFELIVIDQTTGIAYMRNTDWEWAGGNLYNPIGHLNKKTLEDKSLFNERIHFYENFWEEVKDYKFE